jgi:hypothetical protein
MGKHNEESVQVTGTSASVSPAAYYSPFPPRHERSLAKSPSRFELLSEEDVEDKRCKVYEYAF